VWEEFKMTNFYPRIIREFDDKEEPMMYGGRGNE